MRDSFLNCFPPLIFGHVSWPNKLHRLLLFGKPALNSSGEHFRRATSRVLRRRWTLSVSIEHLQKAVQPDPLPGPNWSPWANSYFQQLYMTLWPSEASAWHCCPPEAGVLWAAQAVAEHMLSTCFTTRVKGATPHPHPPSCPGKSFCVTQWTDPAKK